MKLIVTFLLISLMLPVVAAASDHKAIKLTATTGFIADALRQLGGDTVDVRTLIQPGIDPHEFQPSPSAVETVNSSDFIFWIGEGVEEGIADILDTFSGKGRSLALLGSIDTTSLIHGGHVHGEEGQGSVNPHFWMDPVLWQKAVSVMAATLISLNPVQRSLYESNNRTYQLKLQNLDTYITTQVSKINESRKFLITPHDSFAYFSSRYGLEERSLEGISTDSEAGIREIDDMAHYLKDHGIRTIFTETTTSDSGMLAVIDAARALGQDVVIGGQLSALTSPGQSYIDLMEANVDVIAEGILNPPSSHNSSLPLSWIFIPAMVVLAIRRRRQW